MLIQEEALILSAESREYSFQGRTGTSNKVRVSINGEIYPLKATKELVSELKQYVGKNLSIEFYLGSRREDIFLTLKSFETLV